jgi:hypothetical protein
LEVSGQLHTPGEKSPGTHWIGGWVNPRADLDDVEKITFLTLPGFDLDPSVVQLVASAVEEEDESKNKRRANKRNRIAQK